MYKERAAKYYQKYLAVQTVIEEYEAEALRQAGGVKRAAKFLLEDERTEPGFEYKSLCSDRKRYMELVQLNTLMAIMEQA